MAEVSYLWAFFAGLLSFLTPCVLPIVPFYLSYLGGVGMESVRAGAVIPPDVRRRAVISALAFAAGVILVFVAFGATASMLGQVFRAWFDVLRWIAALIIFVMGLHFLGVFKIPLLYREYRAEAKSANASSVLGAFVIGLAFAFGWTPCVGPVLAAILFTAAGTETAGRGMWLLFLYGAGMTLPFVVAAAFIGAFMRFMGRFRRHLGLMEKIMGVLLIVFAILIATETVNEIANWLVIYWPRWG